jgi:hypothetical protein
VARLISTLPVLLHAHFVPRGNSFKLAKFPVVFERDENFVTNHIADVNIWNSLSDSIVASKSVSSSKRSLGRLDFFSVSTVLVFYLGGLLVLAFVGLGYPSTLTLQISFTVHTFCMFHFSAFVRWKEQ